MQKCNFCRNNNYCTIEQKKDSALCALFNMEEHQKIVERVVDQIVYLKKTKRELHELQESVCRIEETYLSTMMLLSSLTGSGYQEFVSAIDTRLKQKEGNA